MSLTDTRQVITEKPKRFFNIKKGSNYVISTSFNEDYVVEFEQFQRISDSLFNKSAEFVTVNNAIINRKYIQKLEPTTKLTDKQAEEKSKKKEKEREDFRRKYGAEPNF